MFGKTPKLMLGRLTGVPVRLDATFLLVPLAAFMALPGHLDLARWPAAALVTLGVFLSVLAHEAGHAAMARRQGLGVMEIVVGGFYGYAALTRRRVSRMALVRVLAAGPAANLVLFLLLWLALTAGSPGAADFGHQAYRLAPPLGWAEESLRVLAVVNIAMFVFNMVPAYPLDGGKILGLLLDMRLAQRLSLVIVSILGIVAGAVMVLLGLGLNLILSFIGIMIVGENLRRLRRSPKSGTAV